MLVYHPALFHRIIATVLIFLYMWQILCQQKRRIRRNIEYLIQ